VQTIIDLMNGRFIDVIVEGRKPLPRDTVVKLADGRIYTPDRPWTTSSSTGSDIWTAPSTGSRNPQPGQGLGHHVLPAGHLQGDDLLRDRGNTTVVNILPQDLESLMPKGMQFMYLWAP